MDGLGKVVHIVGGNTCHGDATILGHVNVELIGQPVHLQTD